ncbi:MAG: sulfotransferase domain-containing protein [Thermomicrobiales bacterium]
MEILIVSPPRSGNHWIRCLLAGAYDLRIKGGGRKNAHPGRKAPRERDNDQDLNLDLVAIETDDNFVREASGGVMTQVQPQTQSAIAVAQRKRPRRGSGGIIMHRHSRFQRKAVAELETRGVHLVTIVRDPYDSFLSYYRWVQTRKNEKGTTGAEHGDDRPRELMFGKPIDHPDVLDFLNDGFGTNLKRANQWLHSGHAAIIRYEDLHADPASALISLTTQIEPVSEARIHEALSGCTIGNMLASRPGMAHTLGTGQVGSSKADLLPCHLEIMRDRWGDQIESLGYRVR